MARKYCEESTIVHSHKLIVTHLIQKSTLDTTLECEVFD